MKYYVDFFKNGVLVTNCFEDDKKQAEHFAKLVSGSIRIGN